MCREGKCMKCVLLLLNFTPCPYMCVELLLCSVFVLDIRLYLTLEHYLYWCVCVHVHRCVYVCVCACRCMWMGAGRCIPLTMLVEVFQCFCLLTFACIASHKTWWIKNLKLNWLYLTLEHYLYWCVCVRVHRCVYMCVHAGVCEWVQVDVYL